MLYKVLDLFAGAGGLSLGFSQTGQFKVVAAAENNSNAMKTYQRNFKEVKLYSDVRSIYYKKLENEVGGIDVIIGGPPCQGFSNANRQHTSLISSNNQLVKEFVRAVADIRPKAFVMENVAMLKSEVHRFIVTKGDLNNSSIMGLPLRDEDLELFPSSIQFEGILNFAGEIHNIEKYAWSKTHYKAVNILYKQKCNSKKFNEAFCRHKRELLNFANMILAKQSSENGILEKMQLNMANAILKYTGENESAPDVLVKLIEVPIFVQRLIGKMKELHDNKIEYRLYVNGKGAVVAKVQSYSVSDYINGVLGEKSQLKYKLTPMTLNAADYGVPQKRERFVIVGVKPEYDYFPPIKTTAVKDYRTIKQAISDLENTSVTTDVNDPPKTYNYIGRLSNLAKELRNNSKQLFNHISTKTSDIAQKRFNALNEGENFHNLDDSLKSTYSNAERTQNTIYLKLVYDEPSGTVVNVRKSMWIHPTLNRAISIREAARLQTFPDTFVFEGSKDSQYQQVGNAVPPFLAKAIAQSIANALITETTKNE